MREDLLRVRDVALRLDLAEDTVRLWLKTGKLQGVKIGATKGGWRIPATEVERVLRGE